MLPDKRGVVHNYIIQTNCCQLSAWGLLQCNTSKANHKLNPSPLDKMAAILAYDMFNIFLNENGRIPIQISRKIMPKGLIDNKSALIQVLAWRRKGGKPLPEAMMTQFVDAYMRNSGEIAKVLSRNPFILTWINFNPNMDRYSLSIINCGNGKNPPHFISHGIT